MPCDTKLIHIVPCEGLGTLIVLATGAISGLHKSPAGRTCRLIPRSLEKVKVPRVSGSEAQDVAQMVVGTVGQVAISMAPFSNATNAVEYFVKIDAKVFCVQHTPQKFQPSDTEAGRAKLI